MPAQKTHNKKRNSGLLYEFLVRTISSALVEGDQKKSSKALKILRRHFKPGTELYKEFRLINSLIKSTVSSDVVAGSILAEAKVAARSYDRDALDKEKSLLIKHINHTLGSDEFYDQQINEYRIYATVQTLINDWRSPNRDLLRLASYEDQLVKWLVSEKAPETEDVLNEETAGTGRLLMKVMTKKLNEKYAGSLNENQKSLLKAYVFSTAHEDPTIIAKKLQEIKGGLTNLIEKHCSGGKENQYVINKLVETKAQLVNENVDIVDDELVTRFMLYTKLATELENEE